MHKLFKQFLLVLIVVVLYLSFLIVRPLLTSLVLATVLGILFYPLQEQMVERTKKKTFTAIFLVVFIFLLILAPLGVLIDVLFSQASSAYKALDGDAVHELSASLTAFFGFEIELSEFLLTAVEHVGDYFFSSLPGLLGGVAEVIIGLFLMFFMLFYFLRDGKQIVRSVQDLIPLHRKYKKKLFTDMQKVVTGVVAGQILTAAIQGALGTLAFFFFGLDSPIFWGFVMMLLAILPMIGTAFVWIPATVYLFMMGETGRAIGFLLFCAIIVSNIDNVIRPVLTSGKAHVHPLIVLLGILGGIKLWGIVGFILGPLLLAILLHLLKFFGSHLIPETGKMIRRAS